MKHQFTVLLLCFFTFACQTKTEQNSANESIEKNEEPVFQNKAHELVYGMVENVGNLETLYDEKDVSYTYTYTTPNGKSNITTEKYIFDGELSYARFIIHELSFPELKGNIEQSFDGEEFWLKQDGQLINDENLLKSVSFSRKTNYYWFAMLQKLLDPGILYDYLGEKQLNNKIYDVVKISFESTDYTPTDIYQLYINKETKLVDQFLFTVADFGKIEIPFLMQLEYETIGEIKIPSNRKYKSSSWDADIDDKPWVTAKWTNITFNNGLTKDDFRK